MTKDEERVWLEDAVLDCFEALHSLMFLPESDPLREEAQKLYDHVCERKDEARK